MKKIMVLVIGSMLLVSCASKNGQTTSPLTTQATRTTTRITAHDITVTEMGIADRNQAENQQRYLSKQAAIVLAERAIRRAVESYIESEVTTNRGSVQTDFVRERVSGALRGTEITAVRYDDPATCYVTMTLNAEKMQELVDGLTNN